MPVEAGGKPRVLTEEFIVERRTWIVLDGSAVTFLVEDYQHAYLAQVAIAGGSGRHGSDGSAGVE